MAAGEGRPATGSAAGSAAGPAGGPDQRRDRDQHADPGALRDADNRLLRDVDGLTDERLAQPSLLPGWSRAHVVAHLALHAEAASGVLEGVLHREDPVVLYPSAESREAAIADLAEAGSESLRDRLLAGTSRFRELLDRVAPEQWEGRFSRVPGEPEVPLGELVPARRREVEVHHADLDVGYGPADWPRDFSAALIERAVTDRAGAGPLGLLATDLERTWWVDAPSDDAVVVSGEAAHLAWWMAGRGDRAGLHASAGRPPSLGRWR